MYNNITLMGQIVSTPELRHTKAGVSVTSFTLAVERRYKDNEGRRKTDYFNIVCWRGNADFFCENFSKGSMILFEGEMQTRPHIDKNGNKQTWFEVIAERVAFTSTRRKSAPPPFIPEIKNVSPEDNIFSDIKE